MGSLGQAARGRTVVVRAVSGIVTVVLLTIKNSKSEKRFSVWWRCDRNHCGNDDHADNFSDRTDGYDKCFK